MDLIKNSVIGEFNGSVSIGNIILSLIVSFIISLFIIYIYKKTYTGVIYSKTYALCMVLLAMVTSLIIRTISSNLALSLGMVGALSIIRFRTAVKEPVDTSFMFWAITAGIMSGAGLYIVAIIASLALGLLYFVCYLLGFRVSSKYLFVIRYKDEAEITVNKLLEYIDKYKVKSKTISNNVCELTFEVSIKNNDMSILKKAEAIDGVVSASIISYQNDFGD
jgi:hypothetical protein